MSPEDFSQQLHEEILAVLWNQWSALGLAGASAGAPEDLIVDPEALLLATFAIGRRDPRLFDEVLDWLTVNGDLVNVPRLRRMIEVRGAAGIDRVFRAVSDFVSLDKGMSPQWSRRRAGQVDARATVQEEVFFRDSKGDPLPAPRQPDPIFRREGFLREQVSPRGMSRSFPRTGLASMLMRLRALIGNSSRCELLCLLATRSGLTGTQAGAITDYAPRTIQIALSEMSRSGYVDSERIGNELQYILNPAIRDDLLPSERMSFPPAAALVEALIKLADATHLARIKFTKTSASVAVVRSEARVIAMNLARAGCLGTLNRSLAATSEDYFATLCIDCEGLIDRWMAREPLTSTRR